MFKIIKEFLQYREIKKEYILEKQLYNYLTGEIVIYSHNYSPEEIDGLVEQQVECYDRIASLRREILD